MSDAPDYSEALQLVLPHVTPLDREDTVPLHDADGRVLSESIHADRDLPPFNRSAMDGYAMRQTDLASGRPLPCHGHLAAGCSADIDVPEGTCIAIATGAPVPDALDLVVPHERSDRGDRRGEPVRFDSIDIEVGHAIHPRAADAARGDVLVAPGTRLHADHLGLAATTGCTSLRVRSRPTVAVLTTGDEVVPIDTTPAPHQIRNGNAPMLQALVSRMGGACMSHRHLPDDPDAVLHAIDAGLGAADMVVTVGGISAGDRDFIPGQLAALSVEPLLRGAAIQPGKPIRVGRSPSGRFVVSLPGNPVSVLATACLILWPILDRLAGGDGQLPWRTVTLTEPMKPNARRFQFRPARLDPDGTATVPSWAGSGDLAHVAVTDGLLALPRQAEPVPAGNTLEFLPWPS